MLTRCIAFSLIVLLALGVKAKASNSSINITLGEDDAIVKLTEYVSFTCEGCAEFHNKIFPGLKAYYIDKGVMQYTMKPYPTSKRDIAAAMLVSCVEDSSDKLALVNDLLNQKKQWAPDSLRVEHVQPLMMENNQAEIERLKALQEQANDVLMEIAADHGVDDELFTICIQNKDAQAEIREQVSDAVNNKQITAVPSFFINDEAIPFGPSIGNDIVERVKAIRDGDARGE